MGKDTRPACMRREVRTGRRRNKPEGDLLAAMYLAGVRIGPLGGELTMIYDDRSGVPGAYANKFIDVVWGAPTFTNPTNTTTHALGRFSDLPAPMKMRYLRGPGGAS